MSLFGRRNQSPDKGTNEASTGPKQEQQTVPKTDDRELTERRVTKVLKDIQAIGVSGARANLGTGEVQAIFDSIADANVALNRALSDHSGFRFGNQTPRPSYEPGATG